MRHNITILTTFPVNPPLFRVPEPRLTAFLDCRVIHGILRVLQETFVKDHLLKKDDLLHCSTIQEFGIIVSGIETLYHRKLQESEMRREPKKSSILVPRFRSGGGKLNHNGGTYSHGGIIDYTRRPISEVHLGIFLHSMEFQSWKVKFKNEACSKTADFSSHSAMDQRSWDGKVNWRTCDIAIRCGTKRFPRLRCVWDDCVCIEKTSWQAHSLSQESKCRRAACSEFRPILSRETNCVHCAFPCYQKPMKRHADEAAQGLSDLFTVSLQNDDVQDFDVGWDQALWSAKYFQMWSWKDCTS